MAGQRTRGPAEYTFPPIAATITGAARLMLALLESRVSNASGSYAFCDTDSMAIVATTRGGLIPCPGGPHTTPDGQAAVRALSDEQVEAIRKEFNQLNPEPGRVSRRLRIEGDLSSGMENLQRCPDPGSIPMS